MSRIGIFAYGLVCHAVSMAVFAYSAAFFVGLFVPTALDGVPDRPLLEALAINLALVVAFGLQHSIMARPAFKRWWTRFVPEAAERSTYLLASSLAMIALFVLWEPIGGVVWSVPEGVGRNIVLGLYIFGWLLLLYATFLVDHFDLFGLKQVWRHLTGKSYRPPQFRTPSLYRVVRHPLYIGWLIIFWAAPTMTVAHLVFAAATTIYILIAIRFEERDLVDAFGNDYVAYRQRTPMLVPRLGSSARAPHDAEERART
jgi:protein-S-isoprenylcysteine O-methyltransferase Ste14